MLFSRSSYLPPLSFFVNHFWFESSTELNLHRIMAAFTGKIPVYEHGSKCVMGRM
jgi:hypothetical protein